MEKCPLSLHSVAKMNGIRKRIPTKTASAIVPFTKANGLVALEGLQFSTLHPKIVQLEKVQERQPKGSRRGEGAFPPCPERLVFGVSNI